MLSTFSSRIKMKLPLLVVCVTALSCAELNSALPRDAFDDADALLEEFKITVATVLARASTQYQQTRNEITNLAQAITSIAQRIINNAQDDYRQKVIDLDKVAEDQDIDPNICTYIVKREVSRWSYTFRWDVDVCINETVRQSERVLVDAFSNLDNLNGSVAQFERQIENCRASNDEICAATVVSQMALQNDLLPIMLESDVQDVLNQFSNVDVDLQGCATAATDAMFLMGRTLMETATMCINNLLGGQGAQK